MIDFKKLAAELSPKIKPYVLEAVVEVESLGAGFLSSGEPKILFEPHVFWRCLVRKGINPKAHISGNQDILYATWQKGKYGPVSAQHKRLKRAVAIDRDCAIQAASWGAFQVLGENWKDIGYNSLQEFINDAYDPTGTGHVRMFCKFIKRNNLVDELEREDYRSFALQYNGSGALANDYPGKMKRAAARLKNKKY